MKTIKEIAQEDLLDGLHINKGDFHAKHKTFTLTQRIQEIRDDGWDVKSKPIPGKRGMVEYWLEPEEIARIKTSLALKVPITVLEKDKEQNEQLFNTFKKNVGISEKQAENESYEQLGIGLLGGHNY